MQFTTIGPAGGSPVRCLEHGIDLTPPGRGLVQQNEKVEARPVVAQPLEQRIQGGGGLLHVFRMPDRQIEIRMLATHEKPDMKGADLFADQGQQKDRLARIIAQHCDMGRSRRNASDVVPPARHPGIMLVAAADGALLYQFAPQGLRLPDLGQDLNSRSHRRVNGGVAGRKANSLRQSSIIRRILHSSGPRTGETARPPKAAAWP